VATVAPHATPPRHRPLAGTSSPGKSREAVSLPHTSCVAALRCPARTRRPSPREGRVCAEKELARGNTQMQQHRRPLSGGPRSPRPRRSGTWRLGPPTATTTLVHPTTARPEASRLRFDRAAFEARKGAALPVARVSDDCARPRSRP
jgi:hypothetical protein